MYFQFANVLVFFLLAFVLCGLMLGLGLLLRPSNPHPGKLTTYECGEPPSGNAWINFNIRFYLIALVFVIFEVEIAFIVPVATVFRDWIARGQGAFALAEIAMMPTGGPRSDLDRFGAAPRATPRVSDLIIVSGTLTLKMALRTKVLYDQMPDPKYVISMGSCANCGGLFQLAYSVCDGVDK